MIRIIVIVSLFWVMPIILSGIGLSGVHGSYTVAEEKKKTRRVPALREQTYKKLAEAQIMIDPESMPREEGEPPPVPNGTPRDAVNLLREMLEKRGLNSYEKAQIWNTLAFAYYTLDDTPNTIHAYEQILAQGTISEALEQTSLRTLFQLYFGEERYDKSIEYIERWEALKGELDPGVTFIKATAYFMLKNFKESLKNAKLVEELAIQAGKVIKENWWYLQIVIYSELNDYDSTIPVLEKLILNYSKKQYWMHLAAIYSEKEMDDRALSVYYAAYKQDMLTREQELVILAQRMLNAEIPYEAASILDEGFESGIVEENLKNMKLLAMAYTMAREMDKAIDAWRRATEFAEDGDVYYRLAQALSNEDRHKDAVGAYRDSLEDRGIRNVSDVQFWLAISLMNLNEWDEATRVFRESGKDPRKSKMVNQYIRYIKGEKNRLAELERMRKEG